MQVNTRTRLFFFILVFFTAEVFGQSVTDATADDGGDPRVLVNLRKTGVGSVALFTRGSSADSSSSAPEVFVPTITNDLSTNGNNEEYTYYAVAAKGDILVDFGTTGIDSTSFLDFKVNITSTTSDSQLYYGILRSDGKYDVTSFSNAANTIDVSDHTVFISIADICATGSITCSELNNDTTPSLEKSLTVVIFLSDDAGGLGGTDVDESTISNGAFYKVSLSNKTNTSATIDLSSIDKGDSILTVNYQGSGMGTEDRLFTRLESTSASCVDGEESTTQNIGSQFILLSDLTDLASTDESGSIKITGLTNNQCYSVRLVFCNDFGFCTHLSRERKQAPEEIEALLKEQGCFFFTAGFGGSHWLIRYFQKFRDNVLRRSFLGRSFVEFYYDIGPKYAPWLLDKPWLRKGVRGSAYLLYGFLHYFYLWLGFSLVIVASFLLFFYRYNRYLNQHRDHLDL
jgi:hypothetical protein